MVTRKTPKKDKGNPAREAAIAHGLPDVPPAVEREVERLSKQVVRYVRRDIEEQRASVESLLVEGASARQIGRILRTMLDPVTKQPRWPNITNRTVQLRITQVRELRRLDAEARGRQTREEQREEMIERINAIRQKAVLANDFKSAIAAEREIAKLRGLYQAVKVEVGGNVNHAHAMVNVISSIDPDLAADLLEEAREEKRLAAKARELLPAIVDAEVEETTHRESVAASEET